jgi:hypothetical protein
MIWVLFAVSLGHKAFIGDFKYIESCVGLKDHLTLSGSFGKVKFICERHHASSVKDFSDGSR